MKLFKSRLEIALELAAAVGIARTGWVVVWYWPSITEPAPVHFRREGQADAVGDRIWRLFGPAVSLLVYAGLTWVQTFPRRYNYLRPITPETIRATIRHIGPWRERAHAPWHRCAIPKGAGNERNPPRAPRRRSAYRPAAASLQHEAP